MSGRVSGESDVVDINVRTHSPCVHMCVQRRLSVVCGTRSDHVAPSPLHGHATRGQSRGLYLARRSAREREPRAETVQSDAMVAKGDSHFTASTHLTNFARVAHSPHSLHPHLTCFPHLHRSCSTHLTPLPFPRSPPPLVLYPLQPLAHFTSLLPRPDFTSRTSIARSLLRASRRKRIHVCCSMFGGVSTPSSSSLRSNWPHLS